MVRSSSCISGSYMHHIQNQHVFKALFFGDRNIQSQTKQRKDYLFTYLGPSWLFFWARDNTALSFSSKLTGVIVGLVNMYAWFALLKRHTMIFFGSCVTTGCGLWNCALEMLLSLGALSLPQTHSVLWTTLSGTHVPSPSPTITSILGLISSVLKSLLFSPKFLSLAHIL